jgi:hypothetical protein
MPEFLNTTQHVGTGLSVEPFGTDGAQRLVPLLGDRPGRAFILDADAIEALASYLSKDV